MKINGFDVLMGRDAKSNDVLTTEIADDRDIWFHAKGVPGSHVIIKVGNDIPTKDVIKKAAEIAAKNSKSDGKTVVVYCLKKFVSKKPEHNLGQVSVDYKNAKTITIH